MLGTFIDTIIVCTITALCILTSGEWLSGVSGVPLTSAAFGSAIADGNYSVTIELIIFAFTTILGWSYYGERCWQLLFKEKSVIIYRALWIVSAFWFAKHKRETA